MCLKMSQTRCLIKQNILHSVVEQSTELLITIWLPDCLERMNLPGHQVHYQNAFLTITSVSYKDHRLAFMKNPST